MGVRSLLGLDLAGKFSSVKRRFEKGSLDNAVVRCQITQWGNGQITFSAGTEVKQLNWSTVTQGDFVRFYEAGSFPSLVEAIAHEEAEIRSATHRHPNTRFYRDRIVHVVENDHLKHQQVLVPEYCFNGVWHHAEE